MATRGPGDDPGEDVQDSLFDEDDHTAVEPVDTTSVEPVETTPDEPHATTPVEPVETTPSTEDPEEVSTSSTGGTLHLDYRGSSHVGLVRKNNQDSGYASPTMLLVADGMGGAAAGDLASAVAVKAAEQDDQLVIGAPMLDVLSDTIRKANNKIADLVADDHSLEGMGTTVSGGLFDGTHFGVCHIGDSRIYLIRDGEMEALTHDHSWVQSLIDEGNITPEEAAYHPHRSLLIKVLNGHPTNVPDTTLVELREGDRLVLCSDGLCGFVDDDEILARATEESLDTALADLIEAALQAGGVDNVTVVVAEVTAAEPAAALEPLLLGAATEAEIPALVPREIDLGDADDDSDDDPESPVRPAAPAPTDAGSDDEEDRRYAMSTPPRRRWLPRLISVVVLLALVAGLGYGGFAWSRTQYYVGASEDQVAIYQGLPQNVLGVPLSTVYEVQDIPLTDLPQFRRQQVRATIGADSLNDARVTVDELGRMAEQCRKQREAPPRNPPTTKPPTSKPPSTTPGTPRISGTAKSPTSSTSRTPGPSPTASASDQTSSPATTTSPAPPPEDCS